jgi:pSer/pThr/pTyr-binding forkhead associated (FHA) protein
VPQPPLDAHTATPQELKDRIAAERRATPFLVYRTPADEQAILDLHEAGDRVTIGRRSSNEVVLHWDAEVSRTHAALERIGDDWVVVDDGLSHNGTYVNGRRVTTRQRLRDGDTITIGATSIAFRAPAVPGSISTATVTAVGPHVGELLTQGQRRVLIALCRPYRDANYASPATNQQIADELVVSVDAVKSTLRALFEIFGVDHLPQNRKRASLAVEAMRSGVIARREL